MLASLTEDVPVIANALLGQPILGINGAILVCFFAYMAWLSPLLFAGVLGFLVVGLISYQLPVWAALGQLHRARLEHDALMKCFHERGGEQVQSTRSTGSFGGRRTRPFRGSNHARSSARGRTWAE